MTQPGALASSDQPLLQAILDGCPELAAVTAHVRAFAGLMTERRGRDLEQWMSEIATSRDLALRSFVTGLRRDQDAVTAGLTLRWSSASLPEPAGSKCRPEGCVNGLIKPPGKARITPGR